MVLDALPVAGWQVGQDPEGVTVLLAGGSSGPEDARLAATVGQQLAAQGVVAPRITVRRVATIPKNPSGEAPLIRSSIGSSAVARRTPEAASMH